jgi:hypothetical protein
MDTDEVEAIRKRLEEHEQRIAKLENLISTKPGAVQKKTSFKEFLLSKDHRNDTHMVLAVGYYLENYESISSFNRKDLDEYTTNKAREKAISNIDREISNCIRNGYLEEAKEKKDGLKAWSLTNTGVKYVECNFKEEK